MKWVIAIIKPHKLNEVRSALELINVQGMTVSTVEGFGRQKGRTEVYRGAEYQYDWVPKIKLEIAVKDEALDEVIETIVSTAKTNKIGDGKIFVVNLMQAIRIRTSECGNEIL
jgi:nitrogen regulatory protein PII